MKIKDFQTSIIIPTFNCKDSLIKVLESIKKQTVLPIEIIIVDNSNNNKIKNLLKNFKFPINLIYKKLNYKSYPGKNRNIGAKLAKGNWLAFIDAKTLPKSDWLESYQKIIIKEKVDVVFGYTKYSTNSRFQEILRASTFGAVGYVTTPGSLISKENFMKSFGFIENVRAGEDIEWRQRILNSGNLCYTPNKYFLIYAELPNKLIDIIKKYFIYSIHNARVNIQNDIKNSYLGVFFLFLLIFITKIKILLQINYSYTPNLENINNIIITLLFSYTLYLIIDDVILKKIKNYYVNYLKYSFLIFLYFIFFKISSKISIFFESLLIKIPNIMTILVLSLCMISVFYRGFIKPINRNISSSYIFPYNWLLIGLVGLSLDLVKSPGYTLGAIMPSWFHKKSQYDSIKKNIVFYTKYSSESASIRYRFHAYENILNKSYYEVDNQPLFNNKFFYNKIFLDKINYFTVLLSYMIRFFDILTRKKPFIAIIHIELFPFLPTIGERILKFRKIPFIIDIDDAVYHRYEKKEKSILNVQLLNKFKNLVSLSTALFAGNNYHIDFFKRKNKNLHYFPTVIDTNYYNKNKTNEKYKDFTIVWVGSPSTAFYLLEILPALRRLKKENGVNILLIGTGELNLSNLDYKKVEWSENTEINYISKSHVGIMPLNNTKWSLGKCGFKILQYMGCGIPVVASPVGVNSEIIQDKKNGLIARNQEDWYNKIVYLKNNPRVAKNIGFKGFKSVSKDFDIGIWEGNYINKVDNIYNKYYSQ
ncbi:MAG: hypothetical protein CMI95_02015 [Pelagibacteraceae bacterium]|nr:hypothetical protein [Pelagibacteraceae bacterium]